MTHPARTAFLAKQEKYGFHEDDPRYFVAGETTRGAGTPCDMCFRHDAENPRLRCDLNRAEIADLASQGITARTCHICRDVTTNKALCDRCDVTYEPKPSSRRRFPFHRREADGVGCVERTSNVERIWDER